MLRHAYPIYKGEDMKFRTYSNRIYKSMNYDQLLLHVKHIEEYKDDPRTSEAAKEVENAIKLFGMYYNAIADELATRKAGKSQSKEDNVVGFVNKDNNYVKYNKDTHDYVIYNPRSPIYKTFTLHKKTLNQYLNNLERDFKSELPENMETENNEAEKEEVK